ncbi:MAG: leucyl/phenylalanyl-tRNA--protein transferase [Bacteroidetes bacterium]|nr:leucyl/phenylalanyl-tRNA--protein transferase [Bacteroidota bacterium]
MTVIPPDDLLHMYASGIFPMAEGRDGPIALYSPDPRTILDPARLHISHSLAKTVRSRHFEIRISTMFERVMRECAAREDTWISEEIIQSYLALHERGFAHSVEAWLGDTLAGGLYGVAIAGAFFGESMFFTRRDASKVALVTLCSRMTERGMPLLDVQYTTPHLRGFGAFEVSRTEYLRRLDEALRLPVSFL